jgi:DNA-binding transcriptional MerR regulator
MARGWESKSIEDQQAEFAKTTQQGGKKIRTPEDVARLQRIQALKLAIANVRAQMEKAQNERYRELLAKELEHLEAELASSSQ